MNVRAGVIASSGGSALAAAFECIRRAGHALELSILTDRPCGIESWASSVGLDARRVEFRNALDFSSLALDRFEDFGASAVLLFYTRLVSAPLIDRMKVWNIHPSLLPAFPGLQGVEQARSRQVTLLGATLHRVDEGIDTGPIEAQVASTVGRTLRLEQWERISYVQKVYLTLVWFERVAGTARTRPSAMTLLGEHFISGATLVDEPLAHEFRRWATTLPDLEAM